MLLHHYIPQLGTSYQCCGAGRSRGFWLEPEPIFLGWLRPLFLASEKQNDLMMFIFHCIPLLNIFLYNK